MKIGLIFLTIVLMAAAIWWIWLRQDRPALSDEVKIYRWEDGGSVGCELRDGDTILTFCLDGRMDEPWPRYVYANVVYPTDSGAVALPFTGPEERAIVERLQKWLSKYLTQSEQDLLWERAKHADTELGRDEWILYDVIGLVKKLSGRRIKDTSSKRRPNPGSDSDTSLHPGP